MTQLVFLLLVLSFPPQATSPKVATPQQQCPITVNGWRGQQNEIGIRFTNNTEKKIEAYKFKVSYVDDFGVPTVNAGYNTFQAERLNSSPKQGHQSTAFFKTYAVQDHGWAAVQAVRFKDGSVWTDDGTLSCRAREYPIHASKF